MTSKPPTKPPSAPGDAIDKASADIRAQLANALPATLRALGVAAAIGDAEARALLLEALTSIAHSPPAAVLAEMPEAELVALARIAKGAR